MNFANGAQSTLALALTAAATSLTVVSAAAFPAPPFHIVIDTELMTVTAVASTVFTVTRGIEGTTAAAHVSGSLVTQTVTAGDFAGFGGTASPLTTKGDIWGYSSANARVPVGANGTVLTADSTQALGVKWGSGGTGGDRWGVLTNSPVAVSGAGALAAYDTLYVCNVSSDYTVTLPAASAGKWIAVRLNTGSSHLLTIDAGISITIDGQRTRTLWGAETCELVSDGSNWFKVAGRSLPMVCSAYIATTGNTLASGTWANAALDTAAINNTGLMFDLVHNAIVIKRGGIYDISACGDFTSDAAGTTAISGTFSAFCGVQQNSTAAFTNVIGQAIGYASSTYVQPWAKACASLSAGDLLRLYGILLTAAGYFAPNSGGVKLIVLELPSW